MDLGISTASYFSRMFTEESLVPMAKLGADVCEVFFATHSEYTPAFARTISEELEKANRIHALRVHSVHALTNQFEPEIFTVNERAYRDAAAVMRNVLDTGSRIGAQYYTFHGATLLKRAVKYVFNFDLIAGRINTACELARSYGMRLCYENVHWAYYSTPDYFRELKRRCPDVGAVLDIKQAMQSRIDYREFLAVSADRLCTVHLCDYDDAGNLQIPGRGTFDFKELFRRLGDAGFTGACLMEVYAKNYDSDDDLRESYDYLKDCMARALA